MIGDELGDYDEAVDTLRALRAPGRESKLQESNRLIAAPAELRTPDGRRLLVTSWKPVVGVGEPLRVSVEAWIGSDEILVDDRTLADDLT